MLVYLSNKTYLNLSETYTISLMYKLNRICPNTDLCGTPQTKKFLSDFVWCSETNCNLFERPYFASSSSVWLTHLKHFIIGDPHPK